MGLQPPRSWLSVTPSLQYSLTEISSPRPPAYSLSRTLNSLENFMRGPLRFCFMVRVGPGINNSLKAPRVIMLCSLNGTHSCSKFHVVRITYSNTGQLVKSQHSKGGGRRIITSTCDPASLPTPHRAFFPYISESGDLGQSPRLLKVPGWCQLCCWGTIL